MTDEKRLLNVTVDDQSLDLDISDVSTFQELVRKVELELIPKGRVLTQIFLNGEFLTKEQEELFAGFGLDDVAMLEVRTAEPIELALTSLNDTLDYIPHLADSFENAAKYLRKGDHARGLALLEESLELVQSFNMLIDGIRQVLMIDLFQIKLEEDEGGSLAALNNRLGEIANEIYTAANGGDWTELADLLEYELSPLLYRYLGAMPYIIDAVNSRDKKSH